MTISEANWIPVESLDEVSGREPNKGPIVTLYHYLSGPLVRLSRDVPTPEQNELEVVPDLMGTIELENGSLVSFCASHLLYNGEPLDINTLREWSNCTAGENPIDIILP